MSASLREKYQRFGLQVSVCCHDNCVTLLYMLYCFVRARLRVTASIRSEMAC